MAKRRLWIAEAIKRPGALRRKLGATDNIPVSKMEAKRKALQKKTKAAGGPGLSASELRTYRQILLAKRLRGFKKGKES